MLFSQLRQNSPIFVLHKDATPYLESGQVTNVTAPIPQISSLNLGQPVPYTVDVSIKVGEQMYQYQRLPANAEVADFQSNGNVFISCTREGIDTEVHAMRQRSADILASVEYHQGVIAVCDKIIEQINPEIAEKARQQEEIVSLKTQINSLMGLIEELRGERASSKDSKK